MEMEILEVCNGWMGREKLKNRLGGGEVLIYVARGREEGGQLSTKEGRTRFQNVPVTTARMRAEREEGCTVHSECERSTWEAM